jgi:two-component system, OmpR family, response regulator
MSVTVIDAPEERLDHQAAEAVVTITVQITLAGDELPAAASRLISDLESLVGLEATTHTAPRAGAIASRGAKKSSTTHAGNRTLHLVDQPAAEAPRVRRIGPVGGGSPALFLHTGSRLLLLDGEPVPLTRREYDLFQFFCENPRRVFTRQQLLRQVWGYDMVGTERTVDVHVRRLRVKLGKCAAIISTVRGVGYRLDDEAPFDIVVQED